MTRRYPPARDPLHIRLLGVAMFLIPSGIAFGFLDAFHLTGPAATTFLLIIMVLSLALACGYYRGYNRRRPA